MNQAVEMTHCRTYPIAVTQAFDEVLPYDLIRLFGRRYGAFGPVTAVLGQDRPWATVGQTRTVRLSDGATLREELLTVQRPGQFSYRLDQATGSLRFLIGSVEGAWRFEPAGTVSGSSGAGGSIPQHASAGW